MVMESPSFLCPDSLVVNLKLETEFKILTLNFVEAKGGDSLT